MEGVLIFGLIIAVLVLFAMIDVRRRQADQARMNRLRPRNTLFSDTTKIQVSHPSDTVTDWHSAFVFITEKRIVAYARKGKSEGEGEESPLFDCAPHEIEGFWRPEKYQSGNNEIELHVNASGRWTILRVILWQSRMMTLVRVLKGLVSEDIVRAYRQRRPYIYRAPEKAQLAKQDIYGAWELAHPFRLYLMPSALVFLADGDIVERMIHLRDIQNITALKRLDSDDDHGLVHFKVMSTQEEVALSVEDHEAWARMIATAAKRTLEDPLVRKRKGYDDSLDEDAEWEDSDFDAEAWADQAYYVGDDGELHLRQ